MAESRLCSIPDCGKKLQARGFCSAHYRRNMLFGDPFRCLNNSGKVRPFFENVVLRHEGEDCLIWPFARGKAGYGEISIDGKRGFVHRLACEAENGPPPSPDYEAAHKCGKGHLGCVSKKHLSWKTHKENHADRAAHGTNNPGELASGAKLTSGDVIDILNLRGKIQSKEIAAKFGVAPETICSIYHGRTWSWLTGITKPKSQVSIK